MCVKQRMNTWLKYNIHKQTDVSKYSSDEEDATSNKWKLELAWLTKALEPTLQLCRWPLPIGNAHENKIPPSTRTLTKILASIQRSKLGVQDWSLSDLTIGLYLIYLQETSTNPFEDVKGLKFHLTQWTVEF